MIGNPGFGELSIQNRAPPRTPHMGPAGSDPVTVALRNEVKSQCFRARLAQLHLENLLAQVGIPYDVNQASGREAAVVAFITYEWSLVHTILSAGGIVSRILFPRRGPGNPQLGSRAAVVNARSNRAIARARTIWKTWPLPPRRNLRPLWDPSSRNAIEHVENECPEWFASKGTYPLVGWMSGLTPARGKPSGARGAFRFFFEDTWRVKVGDSNCSLKDILAALKRIEDAVPTRGGLVLRHRVLIPCSLGPDGAPIAKNACPLPAEPLWAREYSRRYRQP